MSEKQKLHPYLRFSLFLFVIIYWQGAFTAKAQIEKKPQLLNDVIDISDDFWDFSNIYYLADSLASFSPENNQLYEVTINSADGDLNLEEGPLNGKVDWCLTSYSDFLGFGARLL